MDLDAVRIELEQVVREAESTLAALELEGAHEDGELSHLDQDPANADTATDVSEADREEALVEAADHRREEALAALARLDAGTFGACIDCGQQVPEERLAFRPEAARCLSCQQAVEARASA